MKDIIAAVKKSISDLRAKADTALQKLGPLDQLEVGREVLYGLNSLGWTVDCLKDIAGQMESIEAKLPKDVDDAAAKLIEEKVTAGEYVRKTDHDLAIENARKDGETVAATKYGEEKKELEVVTARRLKLITTHGAVLAGTVSDDSLKGDEAAFALVDAEVKRRVGELAAFGIDPVAKEVPFKEYVTFAYTEEGNKGFDGRIAGLEGLGLKRSGKTKEGASFSRQTGNVPPIAPPEPKNPTGTVRKFAF